MSMGVMHVQKEFIVSMLFGWYPFYYVRADVMYIITVRLFIYLG